MTLRAKTKTDTKFIEDLSKERAVLAQKVKDRDEELKGKAKFLVVWGTYYIHLGDIAHCW